MLGHFLIRKALEQEVRMYVKFTKRRHGTTQLVQWKVADKVILGKPSRILAQRKYKTEN